MTRSASSSSTAGRCARCCARCSPTSSTTSPRSARSTGPARWAPTRHNKYARRKNGREPIEPIHPALAEALESVLGETYGLIVYQEQVMAIAQVLAGFTLGQADNLRRAMGKKKKESSTSSTPASRPACSSAASPQVAINTLWEILLPFSDYAFNKSHSAAYGVITYWTAYLKANYPTEYMAALLTSVKDDKDKMAIYLNECRRMKIQVLPPDVNESHADFTPVGNDIRFGLTAVRNVGSNVVDGIVSGPRGEGPLRRLQRLHGQGPGARVQQARRRVADQGRRLRRHEAPAPGAGRGPRDRGRPVRRPQEERGDRPGLPVRRARERDDAGFGVTVAIPDIDDWDKMTLLGHEREMLGLYVSDHPLLGLEHVLSQRTDCTIGQLMLDEERARRHAVTVSGLITSVQRKITKRGDPWAMITLEDLDGAIEVLLFPSTYQLAATLLVEDAIVTVKGQLSRSKDQPELRGQEVTVPDLTDGPAGPVVISLPSTRCTPPVVAQLKDVLGTHPGMTEVQLRLLDRAARPRCSASTTTCG